MIDYSRAELVARTTPYFALVAAIIQQAVRDIVRGSPRQQGDAWRYFASPDYTQHLQLLGQPIDRLPSEVIQR